MSSVARIFAILDLFTLERPVWTPDEINQALGYTRPTGYRYVKQLIDAGFLHKLAGGRYSLGGRIVVLDFIQRQTDPVFLAAAPVMHELNHETGLDVVLTGMFNGQIVDTHRVAAEPHLRLSYTRGRVRPLFQGAAAKVLISQLPRAQLVRLYKAHAEEAQQQGAGESWASFRDLFARIRRDRFYLSLGELEPAVGGAAVPLISPEGDLAAALTLVSTIKTLEQLGRSRLRSWLEEAAARIDKRFLELSATLPS